MALDTVPPQFLDTRWSVVQAAAGAAWAAWGALEELCRLYWFPLYAFARQRGCSPDDSADETQSFLSRVAEGKPLVTATPERGHLRRYLLAAFQRDLVDAQRRERRQKRGGNAVMVPLNTVLAEDRLTNTRASDSPGAVFDSARALTCLETAAGALAAEYEDRGRGGLFQKLRPFLDPESGS